MKVGMLKDCDKFLVNEKKNYFTFLKKEVVVGSQQRIKV